MISAVMIFNTIFNGEFWRDMYMYQILYEPLPMALYNFIKAQFMRAAVVNDVVFGGL